MKLIGDEYRFSSRDLSGHMNCRHLTQLELQVAAGVIRRPKPWDPSLEALWERGFRHERDYLDHLAGQGLATVVIDGVDIDEAALASTRAAMAAGTDVIVQAALASNGWVGRADVLRRVEVASALGGWSYEPVDTKLSRSTGSSTILQLCLYSDMLSDMQGVTPEHMHVVTPWTDFEPQTYRVAEYSAYYRRARAGFGGVIAAGQVTATYPDPTVHCDICSWRGKCDGRRRLDDHLSLVANIASLQIAELKANGISTVAALADMPLPMSWRPVRGSRLSFERAREQARVQVESRLAGELRFETLPLEPGFGLSALPAPSASDIYLDFEGDSFVGEHGQEYLLGYHCRQPDGTLDYVALWGLTREEEKLAFETFIDFVMERWTADPDIHIYHYGAYEQGALKRLMGRYATREDELDRILRGRLMVDLLSVVRHSIRAGVESYSIKRLEPLYGFERVTGLPDANVALTRLQTALELGDIADIGMDEREVVQSYNRDDCVSTRHLHIWLESLRAEAVAAGQEIARPEAGDGAPGESVSEWLARITPLIAALTEGVPADAADRTPAQHARWLLANMLDFHRREEKAGWWEYFRLVALDAEELVEERAGLGGGLVFEETVGGTGKCPIHRYVFMPQETDLRPGKKLRAVGGASLGTVEAIDATERTIDIKKNGAAADLHPSAVFMHDYVGSEPMMESLVRLAEHVVQNGIEGEGPHAAARDLLLRALPPGGDGQPLRQDEEEGLSAALRIAVEMEKGVLPVQGPPGAGKTFTGSRMILELVRRGRRVGIVANSHAVIRNLIDAVIEGADEEQVDLMCVQKTGGSKEPGGHRLRMAGRNADLIAALRSDCHVGGGTAWLWSSPEAFESVDVLFVDEAAQMSLANVLAVSQAARTVVLLGDPRQLDQPMQGSHPEGTDTSALNHILAGAQTIAPERGLFLEETWRLHPSICAFTSEQFYEGKLHSRPGLDRQALVTDGGMASGLRYIPVEHVGNHNCSPEEADIVAELVRGIVDGGATSTDARGVVRPVRIQDVLVITPYNAQVFEIQQRLPDVRVGTVDKFQGQEAPVAIYSLATSSPADAPRGMEFLYSLNRLNVATSRARCVSYLVCNPALFEAECRSPRQMQLANAFCRYLELAE
jgi:predicted RecB family nuclease